MVSLRARIVRTMARIGRMLYRPKFSVEFHRAVFESISALFQPPEGIDFKFVRAENVSASWFTPEDADKSKVILFLHGGGYVFGSTHSYRKPVGQIAKAAGCRLLFVEYRRAPEYKFPAPVEDAVSSYRWLLSQGYKPEDIVIAGDSAGGGLTAATIISLRESGDSLPAAAVMLSPWIDLDMTGESARAMAKKDPLLSVPILELWSDLYIDDSGKKNPLASPIYADFKGFPRLYIQVGTMEILFDDARRLAERAREGGVEVQLDIFYGMWHLWFMFYGLVPESTDAVKKVGEFCREVFIL